jgi:glutaredoxin
MIIVYALKGCNKCQELVEELSYQGLPHKVIYDNEQEEFFDLLEHNLKTTSYPIIEINKVDDIFYVNNIFGKDSNRSYIVNRDSRSIQPYVLKYKDINQAIELIKKEYET